MNKSTIKTKMQDGFTLVEALIFVALLGLVAAAANKLMKGTFDALSSVRMKNEGVELKDYIRSSLDCEKTGAANITECKNGDYIAGRRADGSILFSVDFENFVVESKFRVRSRCVDSGGYFTLDPEYKRVARGRVEVDPLTGKSYDWQPLFEKVPFTCAKPSQPMGPCLRVNDGHCPANFAVFSILDMAGPARAPQEYEFIAQCCPVPADMLLNDHLETTDYCPAGRVSTGARLLSSAGSGDRRIRCTLVDSTKYSVQSSRTTSFYEVPPNSSGSRGSILRNITTSPFPLPLRFNLFKTNNLATDPYYPGTLSPTDTTSQAFTSQCIVEGGNSIITGRSDKYCGTARGAAIRSIATGSDVIFHPTGCTGTATNTKSSVTIKDLNCTNVPTFWQDALNRSSGY